jgi:hypothetical protein
MRKIVLVFATVFITVSGFAQKSADIGIWGGSSTYLGDIKEALPLQSLNLNFGAYFRYNFNSRVGLRTQFLTGSFAADGTVENEPVIFEKKAQDVSAMAEINFLKYVLGEKKTPFTPYIMAGVGVMYFPFNMDLDAMLAINPGYVVPANTNESVVAFTVPFGFGVKFTLGPRLGIGAEYQMRKLFSDKIDNVHDPLSFINSAGETIKYTTLGHNNDWPGYLGIHIAYKLYLNQRDCPAYDRKFW